MIRFEAARGIVLEEAARFERGEVALELLAAIGGCRLARDIVASAALPSVSTAALDGFALAGAETFEAGSAFPVLGRTLAGEAPVTTCDFSGPHAHRVMTGAATPACARAVVALEDTRDTSDGVVIGKAVEPGAAIRPPGSDMDAGQVLVPAGSTLRASAVLPLATAGVSKVWVRRPFTVALLATGGEVVPYDQESLRPEQVRDSNTPHLVTRVREAGGNVVAIEHTGDDPGALAAAIDRHSGVDVILTVGGVSVGDADNVAPVLRGLGADILFHGVAIRPGKPALFARLTRAGRTTYVFGLPGNPAATAAVWAFLVRPLLGGAAHLRPIAGVLVDDVRKPAQLTCFFRATASVDGAGSVRVRVHPGRESYKTLPFAHSNAWVELPDDVGSFASGAVVRVWIDGTLEGPDGTNR